MKHLCALLAAVARGAASAAAGREQQDDGAIGAVEQILAAVKLASGATHKPTIADAKAELRRRGAPDLAARVGRLTKVRNGQAHPDMGLAAEVQLILQETKPQVKDTEEAIDLEEAPCNPGERRESELMANASKGPERRSSESEVEPTVPLFPFPYDVGSGAGLLRPAGVLSGLAHGIGRDVDHTAGLLRHAGGLPGFGLGDVDHSAGLPGQADGPSGSDHGVVREVDQAGEASIAVSAAGPGLDVENAAVLVQKRIRGFLTRRGYAHFTHVNALPPSPQKQRFLERCAGAYTNSPFKPLFVRALEVWATQPRRRRRGART